MSVRYRELNPISSGLAEYRTPSSSSTAVPFSGLVADTTRLPFSMASFTARLFSVEIVDTRSIASANSLQLTSRILSLLEGITRS